MKLYNFIFSKEKPEKYYRHIVFWCAWFLYLFCKQIFDLYVINSHFSFINENFPLRPFIEIPIEMMYIYFVTYFLVPRYWEKRNRFLMVILFMVSSIVTFLIYFFLQLKASESVFYNLWFHLGNSLGIGPVFIYTVFLSIKMMKQFSQKLNEKREIEQAKLNTEIQLLRAQVHPHFLFNTLNNIYSFTLENSPHANELVSKLSDTLFYMINSCDAELVPLEKEVKMIMDYIDLEKVRYGDRLDVQIELQGECSNKLIAPLLMIPLVENAFKHGVSKILLYPPWMKLKISSTDDMLLFELTNAITCLPLEASNSNSGIGLRNVRKRLELLYPGRHEITIHSLEKMFFVRMKIPLVNQYMTNEESDALTHFSANKSFSYV